jgi:hypothetical protein
MKKGGTDWLEANQGLGASRSLNKNRPGSLRMEPGRMKSDPLNRSRLWNPYHPSSLWPVSRSTSALTGPHRETGEQLTIASIEKWRERRSVV